MVSKGARGILSGLRIVELSAFVSVPLGGMTLAQLGAEVIRVDPTGGGIDQHRWPIAGDGASLYWAGLNKGKRSVTVDMTTERGRNLVIDLSAAAGDGAGIVVTNLSPEWLNFEDLRAVRDDVIMVSMTGNPDGSPAVDYTINAAAGYPIVTGADTNPINHVLPAWDVIAGSMVATAILSAERWRSRTGQGNLVRLSLADVAFAVAGHLGQIADVVINNAERRPLANFLYGTFGKDFGTDDGESVMVAPITLRQWNDLVAITGTTSEMALIEQSSGADLTLEGDRFRMREEIANVLQPWFARHNLDEVADVLNGARICWGPYRTFRDLVNDPRTNPEFNPMWEHIEQSGIGTYPAPGSPIHFSGVERIPVSPAPEMGADTHDVLEQHLGMGASEIAQLRRDGVV